MAYNSTEDCMADRRYYHHCKLSLPGFLGCDLYEYRKSNCYCDPRGPCCMAHYDGILMAKEKSMYIALSCGHWVKFTVSVGEHVKIGSAMFCEKCGHMRTVVRKLLPTEND